jgi:sulfatase maturation enzyme AslB (radical SAM superfamily)
MDGVFLNRVFLKVLLIATIICMVNAAWMTMDRGGESAPGIYTSWLHNLVISFQNAALDTLDLQKGKDYVMSFIPLLERLSGHFLPNEINGSQWYDEFSDERISEWLQKGVPIADRIFRTMVKLFKNFLIEHHSCTIYCTSNMI